LQAAQEKFYLQNNKYTDNIAGAPPAGLGLTAKSAHAFYDIAVDLGIPGNADSDQGYTATATPAPGSGQQDDTKCTSLTLTDRGERDATPSGSRDYCWR
jgi:type IV pilus assembly protein PilE